MLSTKRKEAREASAPPEQNKKTQNKKLRHSKRSYYFIRKYNMRKIKAVSVKYQIVLKGFPPAIAVAAGIAGIVARTILSGYIVMADNVFL